MIKRERPTVTRRGRLRLGTAVATVVTILATTVAAAVPSVGRWPSGNNVAGTPASVTWSVVPDGTDWCGGGPEATETWLAEVFGANWDTAIASIVNQWADGSGLVLTRVEDDGAPAAAHGPSPDRGNIRIGACDAWPQSFGSAALGIANPVTDGAGVLLGSPVFLNVEALADQPIDRIAAVVAHEFGHSLGLDHLACTPGQAIMSPTGRQTADLTTHDRLAIAGLYGDQLDVAASSDPPVARNAAGLVVVGSLQDRYRGTTVDGATVTVTVTPTGELVPDGDPVNGCSITDRSAVRPLAVSLVSADLTVHASAVGAPGETSSLVATVPPGDYVIVVEGADDALGVQEYTLSVTGFDSPPDDDAPGANPELADQFGRTASLLADDGYTIIHFCALWCAPCRVFTQDILPGLLAGLDARVPAGSYELREVLLQDQRFAASDAPAAAAWATQVVGDPSQPVMHVSGDEGLMNAMVAAYEITAFPAVIVVDPDGQIVSSGPTFDPDEIVVNAAPAVDELILPVAAGANQPVTAVATVSDPDDDAVIVTFDWGDGDVDQVLAIDGLASAEHIYASPPGGSATLTVVAADQTAMSEPITRSILVEDPAATRLRVSGEAVVGDVTIHGAARRSNDRTVGAFEIELGDDTLVSTRVTHLVDTSSASQSSYTAVLVADSGVRYVATMTFEADERHVERLHLARLDRAGGIDILVDDTPTGSLARARR